MDFLSIAAVFCAGLVIGILCTRLLSKDKARLKAATEALEALKAEYTQYQQQVDSHFQQSDHLMTEFSNCYAAMQEHFSKSIQELSPAAYAQRLEYRNQQYQAQLSHQHTPYLSAPEPQQHSDSAMDKPSLKPEAQAALPAQTNDEAPPKDYATGKHSTGMLSESFSASPQNTAAQTTPQVPETPAVTYFGGEPVKPVITQKSSSEDQENS